MNVGKEAHPFKIFESERERITELLVPGQEITREEGERIGVNNIVVIGNPHLLSNYFQLRHLDFQSIGKLVYPGKSAILDFLGLAKTGGITRPQRDVLVNLTFGKDSKRTDAIHIADIKAINDTGFKVFFSPVKTNNLHVRLVFNKHTTLSYPVMGDFPETPEYSLDKLSKIWRRMRVID